MNKELEAKENRLPPELLITVIILALFFVIALFIRVYLPYNQVFSGEWIKFTSVDAYYHMRLVDNLVYNFPQLTNFDPYLLYPNGTQIDNIHFFDWLLAGIIWVIGLGSPTQHTIDVVGVYFPAFLAALTVIPVYFIGKELFGRWAGVISAGLIAILPGEFLGRSILGFTDHHVAETLFAATTMMFLILAIKASRERELNFNHLRHRDWTKISKPLIYSFFAGLSLGIYLWTWMGALLFVFIITLYFLIQFVIDHLRRKSIEYLCPVGVTLFATALIIYVTFSRSVLTLTPLIIALLVPIVLYAVSRLMTGRKIRPAHYPLALVGLVVVGLGIFYAIAPSLLVTMLRQFEIFNPAVPRTILEMQPLLAPQGDFTIKLAWGNFTTGFFLSIGLLLYWIIFYKKFVREQGSTEVNVLLVWSLIILLATLGQRRFAYYFAVNVALLSGFLLWQFFKLNKESHAKARYLNMAFYVATILFLVFYSKLNPLLVAISVALLSSYVLWQLLQIVESWLLGTPKKAVREKAKPPKSQPTGFHITTRHVKMTISVIIILFLASYFNVPLAIGIASQASFAPDNAWVSSLYWLKGNTAEPFGDPDFYHQLYEPPPPKEKYNYPESAYGVMAWGDYGYWITRIAHRPVNLTPGPGGAYVAKFFLSQDEDSAREITWGQEIIQEREIIQELDSSYIIIDYLTTVSKFWALISWAEKEMTEFSDTYYVGQEDGKLRPVRLFHPEYYRSLMVRLYNFDGQAVTPEESIVISYEEKTVPEGESIKLITSAESFPSYEEATAYISNQESGSYRIVSDHPFITPVPLEELKHYKLIHSSEGSVTQPEVGSIPSVKIFEYIE